MFSMFSSLSRVMPRKHWLSLPFLNFLWENARYYWQSVFHLHVHYSFNRKSVDLFCSWFFFILRFKRRATLILTIFIFWQLRFSLSILYPQKFFLSPKRHWHVALPNSQFHLLIRMKHTTLWLLMLLGGSIKNNQTNNDLSYIFCQHIWNSNQTNTVTAFIFFKPLEWI